VIEATEAILEELGLTGDAGLDDESLIAAS